LKLLIPIFSTAYASEDNASLTLGSAHQTVRLGKMNPAYSAFFDVKVEARIFGGSGSDPKSRCKPSPTMV